jgi:hypothetical protein
MTPLWEAVSGSKRVILGFVPLIAFRRYSGTEGLVAVFYTVISTGIAVGRWYAPLRYFRPIGGEYQRACSKGWISALRVSVAHSSSILAPDGKLPTYPFPRRSSRYHLITAFCYRVITTDPPTVVFLILSTALYRHQTFFYEFFR